MKTVLVAEHHKPTLDHLKDTLEHAGLTVLVADEPALALELFASERPEAVVIAVDFPRLSSVHVGKLLRGTERGALVPMVAVDKGHLGKARGVGAILDLRADGYVADPVKSDEVHQKLRALWHARDQLPSGLTGLALTLSRPPTASGELRHHPLPALFHHFYRHRQSGVVVTAFRELSRRVYLMRGVPVSYDSTARQDGLPNYLFERKLLDAAQMEKVQEGLSQGLRIGGALAEAGVELAGEELLQRLREYVRDKVAQQVGMREGRYAAYSGDEFLPEVAQVEIPALSPILQGARLAFTVRQFAVPLRPYLKQYPSRSPDFGIDLAALGLDTLDLKIAMQMNGRTSLADLIAHGRGDLKVAYSLFWFLFLTGDILFTKDPHASTDGGPQVGAERLAPKRRKPLPPEKVTELRDAAVKIITGSYFKVLGLDIAADTEAVERAYHEVATRFHPDSYAEYDTSELSDLLDSVLDKLSASYRVLSVDERRRAYLQYLVSRLDVARNADVNVDAEVALKRGEAALRRKDPAGALLAFEEAVALNPREPEYYSYLAWATYKLPTGEKKERAKEAQRLLKKALSMNSYLERPQVISAIIDDEQGDHPGARKKLLKVLELNPDSALAKAALRKVGR